MSDAIARRIYWGLIKQGLATDHTGAWDELPHAYRTQLQAVADGIPLPDPFEKLEEFRARSKNIGHYTVEPLVLSYLQFIRGEHGG